MKKTKTWHHCYNPELREMELSNIFHRGGHLRPSQNGYEFINVFIHNIIKGI